MRKLLHLSYVCISLFLLSACSSEQNLDTEHILNDKVFATINNQPVFQSDIDKSIELQLYDLEWRKYELRKSTLASQINNKKSNTHAQKITVSLTPPVPPRVDITQKISQPTYGPENAPINLAVFCSYPSVHCAKMLQQYEKIMLMYPNMIRFTFYDFPQTFHRHSGLAAQAARCANEQGKFWSFHKGVSAQFNNIDENLFLRLGTQINMDLKNLEACLENGTTKHQVKMNRQLALDLGLQKVPVTLINGLYVNGPKDLGIFRYFIDLEIERLNIDINNYAELSISTLPLRLEGITRSELKGKSLAVIQNTKTDSSKTYQQGDYIMDDVELLAFKSNSIVIMNQGVQEELFISSDDSNNPYTNLSNNNSPQFHSTISQTNSLSLPKDIPTDLEYTYRGVVEAEGVMPLSKDWVQEQLLDQQALESHFEATDLEVEGVNIMRVTDVEGNEFYETLGIKNRDVIMRVNDEWVHSSQNNLFESLNDEKQVSIVLMRKGLPVHLKYSIH